MADPFAIEGPAMVSFSGGRTSGYMLRRILDAGLRPDVHVLFANTGKEREETLEFVRDCADGFGVAVHWVEYRPTEPGFAEVAFATASRGGGPFDAIVEKRGYLPNPVTRFCTTELKIRPMRNWMRARGYDDSDWTNVVGIRADEPRRVARMRGGRNTEGRWDVAMPLADAGVAEAEVLSFWRAQPFDLRLKSHEGNCDLCFLKNTAKRRGIMRARPDLATWWIEKERAAGKPFRIDTPSYAALMRAEEDQCRLFDDADLADCICHEGTSGATHGPQEGGP